MKKISLILMSLVISMGLFSQTTPKVQGIEHDGLRNAKIVTKAKPAALNARTLRNSTDNINFSDILFWVGTGTNQAALVIKWNDGKGGVNSLVWGYKWTGTKTSKDMLVAIANADPRFSVLMQNTGISPATGEALNYAIGGLGFNHAANARIPLTFNLAQASADTRISFRYTGTPNTAMGQTSVPGANAAPLAAAAISAGTSTGTGTGKGVIEHPFNYTAYGYPAYDYDWWQSSNSSTQSWLAGWYDGYWSFYVKSTPSGTWGYSMVGASQRTLSNGSVDGWSFCDDMTTWYCADMSGEYTPVPVP